ncbi:hypothetical protein PR048_010963 [Dryococelus australis]|uniref:Nuclease HARBI1 n=1 Tax=Dryococelus australis TaxID=614101 RepID=A0ABQ9HKJ9_9NEOP|nr:hypothetical protein PR048_010963 [Dryococelus australis]
MPFIITPKLVSTTAVENRYNGRTQHITGQRTLWKSCSEYGNEGFHASANDYEKAYKQPAGSSLHVLCYITLQLVMVNHYHRLRTSLHTTSRVIAACAVLHNIAVAHCEPLPSTTNKPPYNQQGHCSLHVLCYITLQLLMVNHYHRLRTSLHTTSRVIAACAVLHNIAVAHCEPLHRLRTRLHRTSRLLMVNHYHRLRTSLHTTSRVIAACAVLHNIAVAHGEPLPSCPVDEDYLMPSVPVENAATRNNRGAEVRAILIPRNFN